MNILYMEQITKHENIHKSYKNLCGIYTQAYVVFQLFQGWQRANCISLQFYALHIYLKVYVIYALR